MAKKPSKARKKSPAAGKEESAFLKSLREHGRVVESREEEVPLPPGATHVLVKKPGRAPKLIEKRKSYF